MFFLNKNKTGFTIIDLLVSLGIFAFITGAVIANFRDGSNNEAVRQGSEIIASLLREAQSRTLSGAVLPDGDFPDGGYGVRFNTSNGNYIIFFADTNGNLIYDDGEELEDNSQNLPNGVSFNLGQDLDIVFNQFNSTLTFNGASTPDTQTIPVISSGSSVVKNIVILRISGQVRVE